MLNMAVLVRVYLFILPLSVTLDWYQIQGIAQLPWVCGKTYWLAEVSGDCTSK